MTKEDFQRAQDIVRDIGDKREKIEFVKIFIYNEDVEDGQLSRMTLWLTHVMPETIDKIKDIAREYEQQLENELKDLEKELEAI